MMPMAIRIHTAGGPEVLRCEDVEVEPPCRAHMLESFPRLERAKFGGPAKRPAALGQTYRGGWWMRRRGD